MDWMTLFGLGLAGVIAMFWGFARMRVRRSDAPSTLSGKGRRSRQRNTDALDTVISWQPQATRVLTSAERKTFNSLRMNLPDHLVLAQVPLARFLKVPTRYSYSEWLRRVGLMCADIVVCDSSSQVIAVVDIRVPVDKENERIRVRNARMDRVLRSADIPVYVWREDALPNSTVARNTVLQLPPDTPLDMPVRTEAPAPTARGTGVSLDPPSDDDLVEAGEPPPSTWFDDLDTSPTPLDVTRPPAPPSRSASLRPPPR